MEWVRGHERAGSWVSGYWRRGSGDAPQSGGGFWAGCALLVLVVMGAGGSADGDAARVDGSAERKSGGEPTAANVVYPITWPKWRESGPAPSPTVSYPIPWDRSSR